jgi:hypothetical protein
MPRTHDGMTIAQRRLLQFWLDAHGWGDRYVQINGELPRPESQWEAELDGRDDASWLDTMPSSEALCGGGPTRFSPRPPSVRSIG